MLCYATSLLEVVAMELPERPILRLAYLARMPIGAMTASVRAQPAPIAMHSSTSRCHTAAKAMPALSRKQVALKVARQPRLSRRASEVRETVAQPRM